VKSTHPHKLRRPTPCRALTAFAACALGLLAGPPSARAAERLIDGVAAQVGTQVVLVSEVTELAAPLEERMREAGATDRDIMAMRSDALERLIESRLIEGVVKRLELTASDAEVDAAIGGIAAEANITIETLYRSVLSHGLTAEEYREKIRAEIERSKVLNSMVRSRVKITDDEVQKLYDARFSEQRKGGEEIHLKHIVVAASDEIRRDINTACSIAEDARRRIEAGDLTFSQMAERVSDANVEKRGDLGWTHREELAGWMLDAVKDLEPGQLSAVVRMPFGCNLFELVDRRSFTPISFADAEPALRNQLYRQKSEEKYAEWVDELRGQTYIERKGYFADASFFGGATPGASSE